MLKFIVQKTYDTVEVDEAAAEAGDDYPFIEESDFVLKDEPMDLDELMRELQCCTSLSDSEVGFGTWAETEPYQDPYTGVSRTEHIHITSINGKEPTAHQLHRLFRVAGLLKK